MISISSTQLYAWIAAFIWPLTRILGLLAVAPPFGNTHVPRRVKIALGIGIALLVAPTLAPLPQLDPMSLPGLLILTRQLMIGLTMGLAMRIVFAAIELAGQLISTTMGLGFAVFFDPNTQGQSAAISQAFTLLATLIFLTLNGHLVLIAALADSFVTLPISAAPLPAEGLRQIALWGGAIFSMGLQLSLPVVGTLLVTNIALGILSRAAPQLNLFGIGFPITLAAGFILIALALPYMETPLERLFNSGIEMVKLLGSTAPDTVHQGTNIPR